MADDTHFAELAARFPEAVLALAGIPATALYRAEALEVKGSGRFDSVVTAVDESKPGATRFYLELQDRHQSDLLLRLHMKILIHVVQVGNDRPVEAVVLFTERRFLVSTAPPIIRGESGETSFLRVRPVVLDELPSEPLERAGWKAWVALPLVGTPDDVVQGAPRWHRALSEAPELTPDERAHALDLFLKLLSDRLKKENFHALLKGQEVVVENTATGKALIAVGEARGEARGEAKGVRLAILDLLDARGLVVSGAVRTRLEAETDLPRLLAILRTAPTVGPDLAGLFPAA